MADHSGYLRLREVCRFFRRPDDKLGIQSLRRDIQARERLTGAKILTQLSQAPNAPLVTTLPTLRNHFPEWFDTRSEMAELLREYVEKINEDIAELKSRDNALASRIRANTRDLRSLHERFKALQSTSKNP